MKQLKKKKKTKSRVVRKEKVENHPQKGDGKEGSTLKMSVDEAASADRDAETGLDHDGGDGEFKQKKQVEEEIGCDHDPNKDEAEDFLWSIVGDDPGLSLNVVTDVLNLCGNDVEKALEVLLELSSPSEEQYDGCCESSNREDTEYSHKKQNPEVAGMDLNADEFKQKNKPKLKKVVASAGTVSSMLGKDYVRSVPEKKGWSNLKGLQEQNWSKEQAEDFLWSVVGDDPGLSLNVVTDVLNLCGNDVEKALEVLLELSSPSEEQYDGCCESSNREDAEYSHKKQNPEVVGMDLNADEFKQKNKPKLKKVVASAGTVSSMLGKDYVRSVPEKKGWSKLKGLQEQNWSKEHAEDFLWSVVGDDPGLSLNVVSDVLCSCENDVEKALEVLLELSTSSEEQSGGYYNREDVDLQALQGKIWSAKKFFRNNSKKFESSGSQWSTETGNLDLEDPREVLESFFTMPAEQEPNKAELTNLFNKIASISHQFTGQGQFIHGDKYPIVREAAHQHRNSMKSYHQNAVTARALAGEADEKASWNIFTARNQIIKNTITVDLHGQHVTPATNIVKIYLQLGACLPSMWSFRFITGYGKHSLGKSKLKEAVVDLLDEEGIAWSEENKGALLVNLDGLRDFSFLH